MDVNAPRQFSDLDDEALAIHETALWSFQNFQLDRKRSAEDKTKTVLASTAVVVALMSMSFKSVARIGSHFLNNGLSDCSFIPALSLVCLLLFFGGLAAAIGAFWKALQVHRPKGFILPDMRRVDHLPDGSGRAARLDLLMSLSSSITSNDEIAAGMVEDVASAQKILGWGLILVGGHILFAALLGSINPALIAP